MFKAKKDGRNQRDGFHVTDYQGGFNHPGIFDISERNVEKKNKHIYNKVDSFGIRLLQFH